MKEALVPIVFPPCLSSYLFDIQVVHAYWPPRSVVLLLCCHSILSYHPNTCMHNIFYIYVFYTVILSIHISPHHIIFFPPSLPVQLSDLRIGEESEESQTMDLLME